jgi:GTP cyclohydrolase I
MSLDRALAQRAVADLLRALGHDPAQDQLFAQTPTLVVDALEQDWLVGYNVDVAELLSASSIKKPVPSAPVVVVSKIAIATLCPHHLLPAEGSATVAYLPDTLLLGLGTIARLLEAFSRRLTLQEQIGEAVVDALVSHGGAAGAYCRLELRHACLRLRGAKQVNATVTTTHLRGVFQAENGLVRLNQALQRECAP